MSSKFTTPIILGSAIAIGALSLVACGEDNGTIPGGSQTTNSSSSYVPPDIPQETAVTAIEYSGLEATPLANTVFFSGSVKLKFDDTTIVTEADAMKFTDLKLYVESANKTSYGCIKTNLSEDGTVPASYFASAHVTTINFDKIGLESDLTQGCYTECGNFNLIISATASDGVNTSITNDTIPFTRHEDNCKIPESSSSSVTVPGGPLTIVEDVKINTKEAHCLNFTTGLTTKVETEGDLCFNRSGTQFSISSGTGLQFAIFTNLLNKQATETHWMSEYLPPSPTTDDFKYNEADLKPTMSNYLEENQEMFTVAINPNVYQPNTGVSTGFYAFVVSDVSANTDHNGNVVITLTYLKPAM